MKHNTRIIGHGPRAWSDTSRRITGARHFTEAPRSGRLGFLSRGGFLSSFSVLSSLILMSSLALADEPDPTKPIQSTKADAPAASDTPAKSPVTSPTPTNATTTPSTLSVEEAKRQALEHQKRLRTTQAPPQKEGESAPAADLPAHSAAPESPPAQHAAPHLPPGKVRALDPEQRAAAIARYREAREAFVELLQAADKKGTPEVEAARAQLDLARVQLTTSRAAIEQQFRQMTPEAKQAFHKKLEELRKERAASRASRAEAHKAKVKSELGESVAKPEVRDELAAHAWRVARLERVIELAQTAGNQALIDRAEGLMKQENARHEKRTREVRQAPPNAALSTSAAPNAKKPAPNVPPAKSVNPAADPQPKAVPSKAVQP